MILGAKTGRSIWLDSAFFKNKVALRLGTIIFISSKGCSETIIFFATSSKKLLGMVNFNSSGLLKCVFKISFVSSLIPLNSEHTIYFSELANRDVLGFIMYTFLYKQFNK